MVTRTAIFGPKEVLPGQVIKSSYHVKSAPCWSADYLEVRNQMRKTLFIAILALTLAGCDQDQRRPGYSSMYFESESDNKRLIAILEKEGFPHYTYIKDEKTHIAYRKEMKDRFDVLRDKALGWDFGEGEYNEYLCSQQKRKYKQLSDKMNQRSIPHEYKEIPDTGEVCLGWPKEYDKDVAELDETVKAIQEAEGEYFKERNN